MHWMQNFIKRKNGTRHVTRVMFSPAVPVMWCVLRTTKGKKSVVVFGDDFG
jgi:hypothetical protein